MLSNWIAETFISNDNTVTVGYAQLTIACRASNSDRGAGQIVVAAFVLFISHTGVRVLALRDTLGDEVVATPDLLGGDFDTNIPCSGGDFTEDLAEKASSLTDVGFTSLGHDGDHGGNRAQSVEMHCGR